MNMPNFWLLSQSSQQVFDNYQADSHKKAISNAFGVDAKSLRETGPTKWHFVSETRTPAGELDRNYWKVKG